MKPVTFTVDCWKKTSLGTPVPLVSSHPLSELKSLRPIVLIGGVHGDEPEGVVLAEATLKWLVDARSSNTGPLVVAPWVLIPCLNVDGYKRGTRVNARGVDLNRNYPSRDWSSQCDKPRYFPGPSPASEPEVAGLVELIDQVRPRLLIHCHSWHPCIIATGPRAQRDGQHLAIATGYELKPEIGYLTPGSLSAYGWHDKQIPVICIEEQAHLTDFNEIWPRFASGIESIFTDLTERD